MRLKKMRMITGNQQGRMADVIEIEDPSDYDVLLNNIKVSNYYGKPYFQQNLGYRERDLKLENLPLAAILDSLRPTNLLELGCGRGDLIFYMRLATDAGLTGIDISPSAMEMSLEEVRDCFLVGDLAETCRAQAELGIRYDLVCALDIWEHLHPSRLDEYIEAMRGVASDDALYFFCLPAFGPDPVFGEVFPLEFEENRACLEEKRPFDYLLAEMLDPPIPVNGHLIWASSEWWQRCFEEHGLKRHLDLESNIHEIMDPYLHSAQRSFFILSGQDKSALEKVELLNHEAINRIWVWRTFLKFNRALQAYQRDKGVRLLETGDIQALIDDATYRMLSRMESEIQTLNHRIERYTRPLRLLGKCVPSFLRRKLTDV